MEKRRQNKINRSVFNHMDKYALLQCATILGVNTTKLISGGITCELSSNQLRSQIAQCLSSGTFPGRINRLQEFGESWHSNQQNEVSETEIDPKEKVRGLIEEVRNSFERLTDSQMLEVLINWIENPQFDDCCYEELDAIAETLGFSYEEINGDYVLVSPSPQAIATKIVSLSDAEFYHSVIALAGLALPAEDNSPPPSNYCAGYKFLENLKNELLVIYGIEINPASTNLS